MTKIKLALLLPLLFGMTACFSQMKNNPINVARASGAPIYVEKAKFDFSSFNPVTLHWYNVGTRDIKELVFDAVMFDEKGEKLVTKRLSIGSGPYEPYFRSDGRKARSMVLGEWYDKKMECMVIENMTIRYTGGKDVVLDTREKIEQIFVAGGYEDCAPNEEKDGEKDGETDGKDDM